MSTIPTTPAGALLVDDRYGSGLIHAIPIVCPAWYFNALPLWFDSPDSKGKTRDIPGVAGGVAQPRRAAPTQYELKGAVSGYVDATGALYEDPWRGLEANRDYLEANMTGLRSAGDGTYTAVILKPSGAQLTGAITPLGLKSQDGGSGAIIPVVFRLEIVGGTLEPVEES